MHSLSPTIRLHSHFHRITKESAIEYCMEHKEKFINLLNKTEADFDLIIEKLTKMYLVARDLPQLGFSDQSLQLPHPLEKTSNVFTKTDLIKLASCLSMQWGKFSFSTENCFMTCATCPDQEMERLVTLGYCTKSGFDRHSHPYSTRTERESMGLTRDVITYHVTDKALSELFSLWGNFRCTWKEENK